MSDWIATGHAVERFIERIDQTVSVEQAQRYIETAWPQKTIPRTTRTRDGRERWGLADYPYCELVTTRERDGVIVLTSLGPDETASMRRDDVELDPAELREMLEAYARLFPDQVPEQVSEPRNAARRINQLEAELSQLRRAKYWVKLANNLVSAERDASQAHHALRIAVRRLHELDDVETLADIAEIRPDFVGPRFSGEGTAE